MQIISRLLIVLCFSHAMADVSCERLSGTWWGTITDETHLMFDEPTPVLMYIEKKEDWYYGQLQLLDPKPAITKYLWSAHCDNGMIKQISFTSTQNNGCGVRSEDVKLDDPLHMTLKWQNAMIDTTLRLVLTPAQNDITLADNHIIENPPKTCH
jgi:hypothetical protein|tara:strand:+ start:1838 stop:2299 length:462 start_codon:yes stop_codon:yes gene_type:complete